LKKQEFDYSNVYVKVQGYMEINNKTINFQ